jgi:exodeoxyribonuclease-5
MRAGATTWRALQSATLAQWLDHLTSAALLRGEIPPAYLPGRFLTRPQAHGLWEQAVARDAQLSAQAGEAQLFDRDGLALAAAEAESLGQTWRIEVPDALQTEEYRAFLRWREGVAKACQAGDWRTADEAMRCRIECIARGLGGLPAQMGIAGFTAPDPWLSRLLAVLEERGVALYRVDFGYAGAARVSAGACADAAEECLAAAAWARDFLNKNGQARVRIAVADLPARRHVLARVLDDALHADAVGAGWAALERDYVFTTGTPLAAEALVDVGLRLLHLLVHAQRVALADFGALLCGPGWSADVEECDARAQLDAELRRVSPPEVSLERLQRSMARQAARWPARQLPQLFRHLTGLLAASRDYAQARRQLPGVWGAQFAQTLGAVGWPGQRELLPAECAACDAWREILTGLAQLDAIIGPVDAGEALRQAQRQCREQSFSAPRQRPARVEICSLADAVAGPVDGVWLMGMNESLWPPAPRPNPLLPAELQRRAGVPAARADSLAEQARAMQALWCASAGEVMFSWAAQEGEKMLHASPLLADIPRCPLARPAAPPLVAAPMQRIDDSRAPPVADDERIRGGTALLQAQALCPAWGFYRYRLGAAVLPAPTFGLDAKVRGDLLHRVMEAFWRGRSQADLLQMSEPARAAEIQRAVSAALAAFQQHAIEPLPPRLAQLEAARLQCLLERWLAIEAQRAPFRVVACEERHELMIAGLPVRVVVDRIDALDDGRLIVIDYKSGKNAKADSWSQPRMREPQLPVYAALALPDQPVAAVALARVVIDAAGFSGIAEEAGLLPDVQPLDAQRRRYASADFPDLAAVRRRWAVQLTELAGEIRDGCAAVGFEKESDLDYCEVKPLLRIAEREAQWAGEQEIQ